MRLLLIVHRDKNPETYLKITVLPQSFSNTLVSLFKEDKERELLNLLQTNALAHWHIPSDHRLYRQIMAIIKRRYGLRQYYRDLVLRICAEN